MLINKFLLLDLSVATIAISSMGCSLLISCGFYRDIIKSANFATLKECLPISVLNNIGVVCLFYSMSKLSPMSLSLLSRLYIVFALIFSVIFFKEKFSRAQLLLIMFSVVGCVLFTLRNESLKFNSLYVAICLVSSFCFALGSAITKARESQVAPNIVFFYNNLFGIIPLAIYFLSMEATFSPITYNNLAALIISVSCFFGSMMCFFHGLEYIGFGKANTLRSFSPVILTMISFPFFPEKLTSTNIIGAVIIVASIACLTLVDNKEIEKS